jgi:anthranilate/para-aminobenzoate synthase component II
MTTVLLVDNYDSFTFNLAQALGALGATVDVVRADDARLVAALDARPDRVVISPGPGRPEVAGRSPSVVRHDGRGIFRGVPDPTEATRYHSLMVEEASLPADLAVTARSDDGVVMALRHARLPLEAVQFHPESVLTKDGMRMLENFLGRA